MTKRQGSIVSFFGNANGPTQQKTTKSYDRDNRKFKSEWFTQFTWLEVEEAKDKGEKVLKYHVCVCVYVCEWKKPNIFTTGKPGSKPKKDDFVKHEMTKDHR
jgi:hypothetical protein